jgi:ABC-type transport system involved in multi-copper enzyme maturation permease subunit
VSALRHIGVFAANTFREAARNKLLYNLLLFAILMIASSVGFAELHLGYRSRIYRDFGLSAIALFGVLIAIFVGINLVNRELAQKTVYTMLAQPVRRHEFLLGKYVGLLALLAVEVAVMSACFFAVLWAYRSGIDAPLFVAVGFVFVELALVTAVALFFSSFTTPYLAGMFTVALWVAGHLLADLRAFGEHTELEGLRALTQALYWVLPNLDRLDFKSDAAAGNPIGFARAAWALGYAALYSSALLAAAALLFRRRDFR